MDGGDENEAEAIAEAAPLPNRVALGRRRARAQWSRITDSLRRFGLPN